MSEEERVESAIHSVRKMCLDLAKQLAVVGISPATFACGAASAAAMIVGGLTREDAIDDAIDGMAVIMKLDAKTASETITNELNARKN